MKLNFNRIFPEKKSLTLERLGFPEKTKLPIVHADDMGMSHSVNKAIFHLFNHGTLTSASTMAPCPCFSEARNWSIMNPEKDIGMHLTLTSDWESVKWRPVMGKAVPSLVDQDGFFYKTTKELLCKSVESELEKELKAQINIGLNSGIDISHIDSHGFSLFGNTDYSNLYLKIGQEAKIPVLLNSRMKRKLKGFVSERDVFVDRIYMASSRHYRRGIVKYYRNILTKLKSGLNIILIHHAFNDIEMQNLTKNHRAFNAEKRFDDFSYFASEQCNQLIKDENITLISWREIRDRLYGLEESISKEKYIFANLA